MRPNHVTVYAKQTSEPIPIKFQCSKLKVSHVLVFIMKFHYNISRTKNCILLEGCEADHPSPHSAKFKNAWNYTSIPPYIFMA